MIETLLPLISSAILISTPPACPERPPILNFKTKIDKTNYIKEKSSDEITQNFALSGGSVGPNSIVRGTANPQIKINFKIKPHITKTQSGHLCGYAQNVDVTLIASPIVHLASEYEFGSCEYREIIKHEAQHVAITKDLIRDYKIRVKKDLTQRIRKVSGHKATPLNAKTQTERYIQLATATVIRDVEAELRTEHSKRQGKIDTPEEYAKIGSRCIAWNR